MAGPGCWTNHAVQVLLVNTQRGLRGFPKGRQEDNEIPKDNALREVGEKTGLFPDEITLVANELIKESGGCHYFVGEHSGDEPGRTTPQPEVRWLSPHEDPHDPDPVVMAQWLGVDYALRHPSLPAHRRELLRLALGRLHSARVDQRICDHSTPLTWAPTTLPPCGEVRGKAGWPTPGGFDHATAIRPAETVADQQRALLAVITQQTALSR